MIQQHKQFSSFTIYILDELLNHAEFQFPCLKTGDYNRTQFIWLLQGLKD